MSNENFLYKVVFLVLDNALCHNVEESVALSIRHHWVETDSNEAFKDFAVEFGSCNVDRPLAVCVLDEWTWISMLQESVDHEGVSSENCLVQCQCLSRIDLRLPLLKDQLQNAEICVS